MKSFLLTMAMCLLGIMPMFASAKDGEACLTAGYSTTVAIGSAYQRTLSKATGGGELQVDFIQYLPFHNLDE